MFSGDGAARPRRAILNLLICELEGVSRLSTDLLKDDGQGAEAREGGLQQIEANECREPEPVGVNVVGQPERKQDGDTGEGENDALDAQGFVSSCKGK